MRKYFIILFFAFTGLMLASCKKDGLQGQSTDLPVIEAYLVVGQPISVKLYQQKDVTDTATYGAAITGIKVYLSDGAQKVQLTESATGTYTYADTTILATGKTYTLQFDYLTYSVSASTVMPAKPTNFATQYPSITAVSSPGAGGATDVLNKFTWSNPDSLNHVLVFKGVLAYIPVNSFGGTRPVNSQANTNRASVFNVTNNTFSYHGSYKVILMRVNQEYINVLNNNTRTSTSQTLQQVPTNIVNGFGIFTAMQADTLDFYVY